MVWLTVSGRGVWIFFTHFSIENWFFDTQSQSRLVYKFQILTKIQLTTQYSIIQSYFSVGKLLLPVAFVISMYATRVTLVNSANRQQSKRWLGATPGWMIDERLEDASSNLWFWDWDHVPCTSHLDHHVDYDHNHNFCILIIKFTTRCVSPPPCPYHPPLTCFPSTWSFCCCCSIFEQVHLIMTATLIWKNRLPDKSNSSFPFHCRLDTNLSIIAKV